MYNELVANMLYRALNRRPAYKSTGPFPHLSMRPPPAPAVLFGDLRKYLDFAINSDTPMESMLFAACRDIRDGHKILDWLLALSSRDPSIVMNLGVLDANKGTLLMSAVTGRNIPIVRMFIDRRNAGDPIFQNPNLDIDYQDNDGETALMKSVKVPIPMTLGYLPAGYMLPEIDIIKLLLDAGADQTKPDKDGRTALIHATLTNPRYGTLDMFDKKQCTGKS